MLGAISNLNPKLQILLTVSPVRHLKETIEINSVSKSVLRVVCHQITQQYDQAYYFPAYEIMMDDLRDYRFYGPDMIHPTETAEDYIWQKFTGAYFDKSFLEFLEAWGKVKRALSHRPFHPESASHQAFLRNTLKQLQQLEEKYNVSVKSEIDQVLRQMLR
jgi:hypothetical protein